MRFKKRKKPITNGIVEIIMHKECIYESNLLHGDARQVIGQLLNRIAQVILFYANKYGTRLPGLEIRQEDYTNI